VLSHYPLKGNLGAIDIIRFKSSYKTIFMNVNHLLLLER
jgi:hypothetical protein